MPRKKKALAPQPTEPQAQQTAATHVDPVHVEPVAEQPAPLPAPPAEPLPNTNTRIEAAMDAAPVVRASEIPTPTKRNVQADPFCVESVTLGESNLSPKMRLFRNNKFQQVAITFDEKPDPKYTEQLRDAGFHYRSAEKAWTRQFFGAGEAANLDDQERAARRGRVHLEAERTFRAIADSIRSDMGLAPVNTVGV